jgi:beta-lactamase regulating signal transducer with metallopeptidase domain
MSFLLQYVLKLSLGLSVVWIFYALFLRRLTFYDLNRWYLVLYPLVAVFIPFINISPVIEKNDWSSNELVRVIPVMDNYTGFQNTLPASNALSDTIGFGVVEWAFVLMAVGVMAMIIRLGLLYFSFLQIRKNAKLINNEKVKVYQVDRDIIPFSFGNSIFINQHQHGEAELREIIRHEFIHVKQKHSMDIIWAEIVCMLNWYNPFAWLIRKAIRQNLEFIADNQVLKTGLDKKQYQYLLLKVIGIAPISIANNFNFSSLKTRIAMMNKMRSAKMHMIRFLFLIPLLAVMLLAFRNGIDTQEHNSQPAILQAVNGLAAIDTVPAKPAVRAEPAQSVTTAEVADAEVTVAERSKTRENVKSIRIVNNKAVVKLKNGRSESFDFDKPAEKEAYEKKYGYAPLTPISPLSPIAPLSPTPAIAPREERPATSALSSGTNATASTQRITLDNVTIAGNTYSGTVTIPGNAIAGIGAPATVSGTNVTINSIGISKAPVQVHGTLSTATSAMPAVTEIDFNATEANEASALEGAASAHGVGSIAQSGNEPEIRGDKIMEIKRRTTKEELEKIKKDLAYKGYTFEIKEVKYDNSIISFISGTVSKGNTKTSFSSDGFSRITIYETTRKDGTKGFILYVSDGKTAV